MNLDRAILAFTQLSHLIIKDLDSDSMNHAIARAGINNPWFNPLACKTALLNIAEFQLNESKLRKWLEAYKINDITAPKTVAIVMAGNIPLVGWHDLMCVILSGNKAQIKLSSKDEELPKHLINMLVSIEPEVQEQIHLVERLHDFDAVIATGSNNTTRYFDYYFGKYPNIIRKGRNSVAILTGKESNHEQYLLGKDIFSFYGLGCRNVSKIYVPGGYDFIPLLDSLKPFESEMDFHKYDNNYTYHKSILLINRVHHYDTGFLLLKEDKGLASAVSVLHYEFYDSVEQLKQRLEEEKEGIQCIVGNTHEGIANVAFGQTQSPELWDYADGVDTMEFLIKL